MSSRKRVKMSRTRIAARFATLAFCSLSYFFFPTWASFLFSSFFLPSPSFSYWLPSLTLLSPLLSPLSSSSSSRCHWGPWLIKGGNCRKIKCKVYTVKSLFMSFHLPLELVRTNAFSVGFQSVQLESLPCWPCHLALKPDTGAKGRSQ